MPTEKTILIEIRDKIATQIGCDKIVCKNSNYVAHFDFDDEWDPYAIKTAKFAYGESSIAVPFKGDKCAIPSLPNTTLVAIEVQAGNIRTATPAWVDCIPVLPDEYGEIPPPAEDVYNKIMQMLSSGVLTGARIVDTIYIGVDENGGNVYKQIFDNGTESFFTAPKGKDAEVIIGEDEGQAYDGSKGAEDRRDIEFLYGRIVEIANKIKANADNMLNTYNSLNSKKLDKSNAIANDNLVKYDSITQTIKDSGISAKNVAQNAENIAKNARDITKNANAINNNKDAIANVKADLKLSEADISENKINISTLADFVNGLNARLNAVADSSDKDLNQLSEIVAYIKSNKGLIDAITTSKVNVTDIIDNLTTSVSSKPLSANQGVVLKTLIDALNNSAVKYDEDGNVVIDTTLILSILAVNEINVGANDEVQITSDGICLHGGKVIEIGGEGVALAKDVTALEQKQYWDVVMDGSYDESQMKGRVLVKNCTIEGYEFYFSSSMPNSYVPEHLHFENCTFPDAINSNMAFNFYGDCKKISGIKHSGLILSIGGMAQETHGTDVEDIEVGSLTVINSQSVKNISVETSIELENCSHIDNIKLASGATATYTNCKYVNPFTCEGFANDSKTPFVMDKDGTVSQIEAEKLQWDFVVDNLESLWGALSGNGGNILAKNIIFTDTEYSLPDEVGKVKHFRFENCTFENDFSFYGYCDKISGIRTSVGLYFDSGYKEITDIECGALHTSNSKVSDVYINGGSSNTSQFMRCSYVDNIRIEEGVVVTYYECKNINPFTCQGFAPSGGGVPMINPNGSISWVESAEGGSYGS